MEQMEEARPQTAEVEDVRCTLCSDGVLKPSVIKPYNVHMGVVMIIVGALLIVTGVLTLIGFIAVLVGVCFVLAKKDVWLCNKCGAMVKRG
jgi:hypothetical protein